MGAQVRWRAPAVVAKGQLATWRGPRVRCTTSSRASRCGIRATITASGSVAAMGFGEARVVVGRGSLGDPSDAHMRRCQGHPRPSRGGRIRRPEHVEERIESSPKALPSMGHHGKLGGDQGRSAQRLTCEAPPRPRAAHAQRRATAGGRPPRHSTGHLKVHPACMSQGTP